MLQEMDERQEEYNINWRIVRRGLIAIRQKTSSSLDHALTLEALLLQMHCGFTCKFVGW